MTDKVKIRVRLDDILQKVSNKTTAWNSTPTDTHYPSEKLVKDTLDTKENLSNKTTTLTSNSTDTQYPTAKTVYDKINEIQSNNGGGNYISDYYFDTTNKEIVLEYTNNSNGNNGGNITVDASLSTSSANPVQNKAITNALLNIIGDVQPLQDIDLLPLFQLTQNYGTDGEIMFNRLGYSIDDDVLFYDKGSGVSNDELATQKDLRDYVQATKVNSWSATASNNNVPSEKLVKDTIDDLTDLIGDAITYINQ